MDKLIAYLNSLDKDSRTDFAKRCLTSEGYMRKARSANQKFRCELCVRIEQHSNGAVTRKDLRDDWADVWPELAKHSAGTSRKTKESRARAI
ncbi:transcriptional regulator [Paraburkholderia graminis]|uniref:transcriptional regulator n=1 Tax=Paraburkholderia graminis TaxID=60548 RepID=UPI0038BE1C66